MEIRHEGTLQEPFETLLLLIMIKGLIFTSKIELLLFIFFKNRNTLNVKCLAAIWTTVNAILIKRKLFNEDLHQKVRTCTFVFLCIAIEVASRELPLSVV